jgi:hypothetical protein
MPGGFVVREPQIKSHFVTPANDSTDGGGRATHDCRDAGVRATHGAVAEEAKAEAGVHLNQYIPGFRLSPE